MNYEFWNKSNKKDKKLKKCQIKIYKKKKNDYKNQKNINLSYFLQELVMMII